MTDTTSWFAHPNQSATHPGGTWADRFRGAMLGGAVGDALGAGVRRHSTPELQQLFGPQGIVDYVPVFGRRGAVTDITQISVFTLEALLRAKASNADPTGWLPTHVVTPNHLRWFYTQGVPWEYAMAAHLQVQPEPSGWLLERPELFSTRNPTGFALHALGRLVQPNPPNPPLEFACVPDCIAWGAPTMLWGNTGEGVFSAGRAAAGQFTQDVNTQGAAGLHSDVLAQLIRGAALWDAVSASEKQRLSIATTYAGPPADVHRTVHAAMFAGQRGQRLSPGELDIEFDTYGKPGELGIALASVACTDNFVDAVLMAVNQSADSSVTGALAGQLAGALYGPAAIPPQWIDQLDLREIIELLCADAAEAFAPPETPRWAQRYVAETRPVPAEPLALPQAPSSDDERPAEVTTVIPAIRLDEPDPREDFAPEAPQLYEPEPVTFAPEPVSGAFLPEPGLAAGQPTFPEPAWRESEDVDRFEPEEPVEDDQVAVLDEPIEVEEYDVEDEEDLAEEEPSAELEVPAAEVEPTIAAEVEPLADAEPASVLEPLTSPESLTTDEPLAEPESFTASESLAEPEPLVMPELLTESEPLSEPDEDLTESEQLATEPTEAGSVTEADAPDPVMPDEEADEEPEEEAEAAPEPVEPPVLPTEDDIPDFPSAEPAAVPAISSGGHAKVEDPDYVAPSLTERVLGCFLGGALGDSLGSDLEFKTAQEITAHFGPEGPRGLREAYGVRGAITDDTQMTLFTAEGLIRGSIAQRTLGTEDPLPEVQLAYQRWLHTQGVEWAAAAGWFISDHPAPDGWLIEVPGLFSTRGPGKTVFRALSGFGDGEQAGSFTHKINDSKGCGGVMRAAPVALYSADPAEVFELAARTAALTHTHPAGFHSAGALAVIVQQALLGRSLDDGVWLALQVLETWPDHDETTAMLKLAVELAGSGVPSPGHVEEVLGGGWVGEEALAIAVCAALVGGDDVELALRVAAHHSGDSDSTAAICGNIVGALLGVSALPVDWLADLELRDVIEQMALDCVVEFGVGAFHPETPDEARPVDQDWNDRYPVRPVWTERPGSRSVEQPTRRLRAVAADDPEPLAEFPAPKPSPRRINGVMPGGSLYEGDR